MNRERNTKKEIRRMKAKRQIKEQISHVIEGIVQWIPFQIYVKIAQSERIDYTLNVYRFILK